MVTGWVRIFYHNGPEELDDYKRKTSCPVRIPFDHNENRPWKFARIKFKHHVRFRKHQVDDYPYLSLP